MLIITFYPALMGSKTLTSKCSESKEFRWGMKKTPLIKVSIYPKYSNSQYKKKECTTGLLFILEVKK